MVTNLREGKLEPVKLRLNIDLVSHLVYAEVFGKFIKKVKSVTLVEGNPKAPFSKATTPRCRGGRYSIPWIAPLYAWSLYYNAQC